MSLLTIARFTFQEAISRKLILAALALSVAFLGLFFLGFSFAYGHAAEEAADTRNLTAAGFASTMLTVMGLYAISFLASFLALFVSVGAIASEIDAGTLHAVLARPLRRSEVVLGRWLAYVVMLTVYVIAMSGAVFAIAISLSQYEAVDPARATLLMALQALLLMTLSLLGSTLMSTLANGVVVFSLFGLSWLAGIIELLGTVLRNEPMRNLGIAVSLFVPSDALWRGASYYAQSSLVLVLQSAGQNGIPFASWDPPVTSFVLWSIGYVLLCLLGAIAAFRRRDL